MSIESASDPWLSPNRQAEFPTRLVLSTVKLHRRREKTFLVLAALLVLSAVALPLFGAGLAIDVTYLVGTLAPQLAFPRAELAFGVLVLPLGMFAISAVVELYGRRRAYALALVGFLASCAAIGLLYANAAIASNEVDLGMALAFAIAAFVAHLVIVPLHANMRAARPTRRFAVRKLVSTLVALLAAWTVFSFALYAHAVQMYGRAEDAVIADIGALFIGGATYTVAVALVDVLPFVALVRGLAIYLRVGRFDEDTDDQDDDIADAPLTGRTWSRPAAIVTKPAAKPAVLGGSGTSVHSTSATSATSATADADDDLAPRRLPAALIVETPQPMKLSELSRVVEAEPPPAAELIVPTTHPTEPGIGAKPRSPASNTSPPTGKRRDKRTSIQPFSSAEMRFFTEGDELGEASENDPPSATV